MKIIKPLLIALIVTVIVFWFGYIISQSNLQVLNPKGIIASGQRDLIVTAMAIMLSIAIPVVLTAYYIAWKYRDGGRGAHEPDKTGGKIIIFTYWLFLIELAIVFFFLVIKGSYGLDPHKEIVSEKEVKIVQVVALDWKWLFIYPEENIATVNFLQIPVDTPVRFELTADGPMNSFWIPSLGGQIYSMAAMETKIHLMANSTGDFPGEAAEINGRGFAGMRFVTRSSSGEDYDKWVREIKNSSNELTKAKYEILSKPSENLPVIYYSSVQEGLFNSIMDKYMAPGTSHRGESSHGH